MIKVVQSRCRKVKVKGQYSQEKLLTLVGYILCILIFLYCTSCLFYVSIIIMVEARTEEVINASINTKVKATNTKPKSVYSWNVVDVQKWLRRHCSDYYQLYVENFTQHEITGRSLLRINDNSLLRLGITNDVHREAIWKQILKLRLKTDIVEIRDLQRRNINNMYYDNSIV